MQIYLVYKSVASVPGATNFPVYSFKIYSIRDQLKKKKSVLLECMKNFFLFFPNANYASVAETSEHLYSRSTELHHSVPDIVNNIRPKINLQQAFQKLYGNGSPRKKKKHARMHTLIHTHTPPLQGAHTNAIPDVKRVRNRFLVSQEYWKPFFFSLMSVHCQLYEETSILKKNVTRLKLQSLDLLK